MDKESSAIGSKLIKRLSQRLRAFLRLEYPGINALCLIGVFWFLGWYFQTGLVGKLEFENRWHGFYAGCFFHLIPLLSLANSFLFKRVWVVRVSQLLSLFFVVIMLTGLLFKITIGAHEADDRLIRRTTNADGQTIALYAMRDPEFPENSSRRCRHLMLQKRVLPGLFLNERQFGDTVCGWPETLPPHLK